VRPRDKGRRPDHAAGEGQKEQAGAPVARQRRLVEAAAAGQPTAIAALEPQPAPENIAVAAPDANSVTAASSIGADNDQLAIAVVDCIDEGATVASAGANDKTAAIAIAAVTTVDNGDNDADSANDAAVSVAVIDSATTADVTSAANAADVAVAAALPNSAKAHAMAKKKKKKQSNHRRRKNKKNKNKNTPAAAVPSEHEIRQARSVMAQVNAQSMLVYGEQAAEARVRGLDEYAVCAHLMAQQIAHVSSAREPGSDVALEHMAATLKRLMEAVQQTQQ
jgi:hypothetical protein